MGKAGSCQRDRARGMGLKHLLKHGAAVCDENISSQTAAFLYALVI